MSRAGTGQFYGDFVAWSGGCLLIGEGEGSIAPHAHYSIQIAFGFPSGLRVQMEQGPWIPCGAAIVPSRAIHSIDTNDAEWGGVLFVEPETPEGRALTARLNGRMELLSVTDATGLTANLERAWRREHDRLLVESVCREFIGRLSETVARDPSDPRVLAAIDYIRKRIDTPISLPAVAKVAHLSPGRFRHLFVEETGMPLRTYVLWRRLLQVWTLLTQGKSLSEAAHAAGFADSAHLSRTSRTMFGTTPSALQMSGPLSRLARKLPY
ncbi:MAG: AraC family transcriptional regulator [Pseudomonadota bacterium]|nr:AraC family transcriptional regulator [Pseudomonadota bacterium]